MARAFHELEGRPRPDWVAASDPAGRRLGSGGAAAHLLINAWQATGGGQSFQEWLGASRKLLILGDGQNQHLPAYSGTGKSLMPIPVFRWSVGQRLDQSLLDLQLPLYHRVLNQAADNAAVLVASGDVFLKLGRELPPLPSADMVGLGLWVTPEVARHFGVFFCPRHHPDQLAFFLQKPAAARLRELSTDYCCLVDAGLWILSRRAVRILLERCGWNAQRQVFEDGQARPYSLYSQFGLALGRHPSQPDPLVSDLSTAVAPLEEARFQHFGNSREMIQSVSAMQNFILDETKIGSVGARRHPDQFLQNARFHYPLRLEENHTLWVENSVVPDRWKLACDHVLTGVPDNDWPLRLEAGVCLDFCPVGEQDFCVRAYGIDDALEGKIGDVATTWFGRPLANWFRGRSIDRDEAGLPDSMEFNQAPLFPVLSPEQLEPRYLAWLFSGQPEKETGFAGRWLKQPRLSNLEIGRQINPRRLYQQRARLRQDCLPPMLRNYRWSVFFKLDLESTARLYAATSLPLPSLPEDQEMEPMQSVRSPMFRAAVQRWRNQPGWEEFESQSFARLRELIVRDAQLAPVCPRRNLLEDQIVWGRSPVRFDLAGGWTDTPPYCLEHGGRVVNLAVNLNGQPPIQVFARLSEHPEIVLRSIDLGVEQHIRRFEELEEYNQPGHEFALAKAAFALTGFLPRFHSQGHFKTLEEQLRDFGGGIEVSLLSAVPKGSGLGTSSILAATLLATLSDLCGLNWDRNVLFTRTMALEQMLTTGGGWQDQAGGIFRGLRLIETGPGLVQKPILRWLPEHLFEEDFANKTILLYYTGLTRLAKNILHEIVRGIFLNSPEHLQTVDEIGANAERAFQAIQREDYPAMVESIRMSWMLNQHLDAGTNPPGVQQILAHVEHYLDAAKLLGAGGGGYLLMFAKDAEAAARVRRVLTERPPNSRARFVNFEISNTGLQLTRS